MRADIDARTVGRRHRGDRPRLAGIELMRSPLSAPTMLQGVLAGLALAWAATLGGWQLTAASPLAVDVAGLQAAEVGHTPWALGLARVLSYLGHALVVTPVTAALALAARWRWGDWSVGLLLATVLAGSTAVTGVAKVMTARPRPDAAVIDTLSSAFPSGHAVRAVAVYGLVAWLVHRLTVRRGLRRLIVATAVALVLLGGLARVALGVHWPTDVLAGFAVGATWLSCCLLLLRPRLRVAGPVYPSSPDVTVTPDATPVASGGQAPAGGHDDRRERAVVAG